jgi:transposase InsO family protein
MMCRLLSVPRSSYYQWAGRAEVSATAARRAQLTDSVVEAFQAHRRVYGCRRVARALNRHGVACSVGLVADIMRERGLRAIQPRAWKRTTIPGTAVQYPADALEQDFTAQSPGARLVGDITYLHTGEGWLFLATVIDLCTRMVVGWQMADHMRSSLVVEALDMARIHGHVAKGAVFHSDRGTQYTSKEFVRYCVKHGITRSMGRTGVCFDNAAAESFFATLKNEMYHHYTFATRGKARFAVAEYIEVFYNRQRLHSTLGYRTPAEALTDHQHHAAQAA